jgi:hypothetical protein
MSDCIFAVIDEIIIIIIIIKGHSALPLEHKFGTLGCIFGGQKCPSGSENSVMNSEFV